MANAGALNQAPAIHYPVRIAGIDLDIDLDVSASDINVKAIVDARNDETINEYEFGI